MFQSFLFCMFLIQGVIRVLWVKKAGLEGFSEGAENIVYDITFCAVGTKFLV